MTKPWQRYQADLQRDDFSPDPAQEETAISALSLASPSVQDTTNTKVLIGPDGKFTVETPGIG